MPLPREMVFMRDMYRCLACGSEADLTVDHIVPSQDGGSDAFSNLQTLCRGCNARKSDRTYSFLPGAKRRFAGIESDPTRWDRRFAREQGVTMWEVTCHPERYAAAYREFWAKRGYEVEENA